MAVPRWIVRLIRKAYSHIERKLIIQLQEVIAHDKTL